jgi:hypothetical protein
VEDAENCGRGTLGRYFVLLLCAYCGVHMIL